MALLVIEKQVNAKLKKSFADIDNIFIYANQKASCPITVSARGFLFHARISWGARN